MACAEVLPFEGGDPIYLQEREDNLQCNDKY